MTRKKSRSPSKQPKKPRGFGEFRNTADAEVLHFYSDAFNLDFAQFQAERSDDQNPHLITKKALVMVEGNHIDSAKRKHVFDAERIQRIVHNTNRLMTSGGRVPWQTDHKKEQAANIGDLEGLLEVRVITAQDLPNPRLKHLIGKVGAFTSRLVAKGMESVQDVLAGKIKTLSPGIDVLTDTIREISATPTPAIVGLSTFSRANFALTMAEVQAESADMDSIKQQLEDLNDDFFQVVTDISQAPEEELQGQAPEDLIMQAINDYASLIQEALGLTQDQQQQQPGIQGQQAPPMNTNQTGGYGRMNASRVDRLAMFTMNGLEAAYRAEFRKLGAKDKQKRKPRGLLGTAARVGGIGAGVAGLGAAGYGGSLLARGAMSQRRSAKRIAGVEIGAGTASRRTVREAARGGLLKRANTARKLDARRINQATSGVKARIAQAAESDIGKKIAGVAGSRTGKIGLGLAGAAALGGAGYAGYRALRKKRNR